VPELPEVDVMVDKLRWLGTTGMIKSIEVLRGVNYFADGHNALGKKILHVSRRGKYICFDLSGGARIICHNAMSGFWDADDKPWTFDYVEGKRKSGESDVRVKIDLDFEQPQGFKRTLFFHDARLFGRLYYYDEKIKDVHFRGVGPDALQTMNLLGGSPVHTAETFEKAVRNDKHTLKEILLKQSIIAGVGNIYAAEALWLSKLSPFKLGTEITSEQSKILFTSIRVVFEDSLSRKLDYSQLRVYRRKECLWCSTKISKHSIRGRSTYWCPKCQS
jgi:formamidopyrimidine-DNA glycosylase